jgi:hypothetical protein
MGLDTYAAVSRSTKFSAVRETENGGIGVKHELYKHIKNLVGGMLSANGQGSFRGKCYDQFIEDITGESLYQEEIRNDNVIAMAEALEEFLSGHMKVKDQDLINVDYGDMSFGEARDLAKWFRVTADNGYSVVGWW